MDSGEFKQVLIDLGKREITEEQVQAAIKSVDRNNDHLINWTEFLEVTISSFIYQMFVTLKNSNKELFGQVLSTKKGYYHFLLSSLQRYGIARR